MVSRGPSRAVMINSWGTGRESSGVPTSKAMSSFTRSWGHSMPQALGLQPTLPAF